LVPEIIKFFVNHVQKFKCQAKIMSYAKVDCSQFKSRRLKVNVGLHLGKYSIYKAGSKK